jgi:HlyD family secretion protein
MKFKLSRKILIISIIAVLVLIWIFTSIIKNASKEIETTTVVTGTLIQDISETGMINQGQKIDLSFKTGGQISNVFIKEGDDVRKGQYLVRLDNNQLSIQLLQAQAQKDLSQAEFDRLLAGATEQEIKTTENTVADKQKALENAIASAEQSRIDAYQGAMNNMADSYLYTYNSYSKIKDIQKEYFSDYTQDSVEVRNVKDDLEFVAGEMEFYLDKAEAENIESNIDYALNNFEINLAKAKDGLNAVRMIMDKSDYNNSISAADKTSVDTHRGYINTELSSVTNDKQTVASIKISNKTNTDLAQSALTSAQDALTLLTADPREEDVALYQAKLDGAKASVSILRSQLNDTYISAPFDGVITNIDKYVGEVVSPSQGVVSVIPSEVLEIEVDIYEEDVVAVRLGNPVKINLVAFPDQEFMGSIIFINPSEKLVDGIVYYEAHIAFEEVIQGIKPGMSADVEIITLSEDNVLMASDSAIYRDNGDYYTTLREGKRQYIEIGRKSNDDMVEIISGLTEGQELIIE